MAKKRRKTAQPPVAQGDEIHEDLPFAQVYYPNGYGTFFAFAKNERSMPHLCACNLEMIQNFLRIKEQEPEHLNSNPMRMSQLDSLHFPDVIAQLSLESPSAGIELLNFGDNLCHRCNLTPPTLRYCHEMYGTRFIQHFGWYVNQAYLRVGIKPRSFFLLPDVCPPELQQLIRDADATSKAYQREHMRLNELVRGPPRDDIADDEITYWHNVKLEEAEPYVELRRKSAQATRRVTKRIEDIARQEFGFRKVGEGWVSETLLYQLICRLFPNAKIHRHHRPDWLGGLELDVYIPELSLAIEYQGQQHFHPIKAWGGEAALQDLQNRDRRKAKLCVAHNVKLFEIRYSEPLTEAHMRERLLEEGKI